jgi:ribulose-5-phosphate 4-epimerase/fuculose-1-phosphate aldolase
MDSAEDTEPRKFFCYDGCLVKLNGKELEIQVRTHERARARTSARVHAHTHRARTRVHTRVHTHYTSLACGLSES